MVGEIDGQIRCQILSRLARAFLLDGDSDQAHTYNAQALEIARRLGDELVLFDVQTNDLLMSTGGRSPSESERRRVQVEEILATADHLKDNDRRGRALSFDIYFAAEIGDRERLDRSLAALTELGEAREMMHILWIARHGNAMQALLEGDFGEAERHAEAALELGHQTHGDGVEGVYGIQMFTIRREQGRLAEVAPIIKRMVEENPSETTWRPGFALIACDLGFTEPARRILEELAASGFTFALDAKRSTTLAYLAEACATLGDERYAEALYNLLKPHRHMTITTGVMTVCYGAAARYLGQLASVMCDWESAEEHFKAALSMNAEMRAWPWLAHSQHAYALMLQRRNRPGDADAAHELVQESLATAKRLGMVALQSKLQGLVH
jgi:tetratricopeptide (TPR) repeat protein